MKLEKIFHQESDENTISVPSIKLNGTDPILIWRDISYRHRVICFYGGGLVEDYFSLNVGVILIELIAKDSGLFVPDKSYSKKHLSEYPSSALAIRDAIRLFDEVSSSVLPNCDKTEEDAWEEWREQQEPKEL